MAAKNTLIVRSMGIFKPPLLVTNEAMAVEMYGENNELIAVIHRVLDGNYWTFTSNKDPDWHEVIRQLGYIIDSAELDINRKKGFLDG